MAIGTAPPLAHLAHSPRAAIASQIAAPARAELAAARRRRAQREHHQRRGTARTVDANHPFSR